MSVVMNAVEEVARGATRIAGRMVVGSMVVGGGIGLAALGSLPTQAQQKTELPAPRTADEITAECVKAHAPNQGKIAECILVIGTQENIQATYQAKLRSDEAQLRSDEAQARTACWNEVGVLRKDTNYGATATEIARQIVKASGIPAAENEPCALRDAIKKGLTDRGIKVSTP